MPSHPWKQAVAVTSDAATRVTALLAVVALLPAVASTAQTLPYIPTTVLLPDRTSSNGSDIAYIFRPSTASSDGKTHVDLLSIKISATVDGDTSIETISSDLPFLRNAKDTTAFLPTVADNGTIIVQAGDCAAAGGFDVWTYTPADMASDSSDGSWEKAAANTASDTSDSNDDEAQPNPHFLGAAISYSSVLAPVMSDPILYSYGGMCSTPSEDASSWQSAANYSKQMVRVARDSASESELSYTASLITSKGPAFPEAGFSLTPLSPSITNRSDTITQQRGYVLLGGHTETAFINMSTAAIWNLPAESWSFLSINGPDSGLPGSELAVKGVSRRATPSSVDSRSGHTAVLNEAGDALVVLGGWVGTVAHAADPQLAVLRMGNSYGEWAWEIPDGQPQGSGVYGHGAVLLPGNVMMTYGGFEISGSSSKVKRQQNSGSPRFLNLTSLSWGSSYTNPSSSSSSGGTGSGASEGSSKNDNINETMKKVGLGVGLGVGLLAVIGAIIVWFCYRKRIRKQRQDRDRAVQGLAQDAARFLHADDEMVERDDPWSSNSWYTGGHDPYDQNSRSLGYETLRNNRSLLGGYGGNAPAGLLIPRKPVISKAARGAYQPTASRPSNLPTAGHIHPIYEADEEAPDGPVLMRDPDMGPETPTSQTYSDPFATPRHSGIEASTSAAAGPIAFLPPNRAALTPSPDRNHQRGFVDPEVQDWQSDVDAAEALFAQMPPRAGRGSPTRRASMRSARSGTTGPDDERTGSGLSDSNRSTFSSLLSRSGSAAGTARSYTPYRASPTHTGTLLSAGGANNNDGRLGTSGSGSGSSSSNSAHTFSTAKSNFTSLQAEGPSLLLRGERSSPTREQHYQGGHARGSSYPHHGDDDDEEDNFIVSGSPSKSKPRRGKGWLGSLRRVFSVSNGGSPADSSVGSISPARRSSLDGRDELVSTAYESRLGLSGIGGAELLRRKQGRSGWQDGEGVNDAGGSGARGGDEGPPPGVSEEDWDIERAIEKRLVQFMFTVPKERLRVVNGDEASIDDGASAVDPEKVGLALSPSPEEAERQRERPDVTTGGFDPRSAPSPEPLRIQKKKSVEPVEEVMDEKAGAPSVATPPPSSSSSSISIADEDLWAPARGRELRVPSAASERELKRISTTESGISESEPRPSLTLRTAEAVRIERPKTRVLRMVESFEVKSREGSPSPTRGSP
ncbi:hypothetical protein VD0002_g9820 [Verticillium dahliae]|uniref:Galactose oxidase n=3 Tax=Verticillium dahliae TaxID=27337 RepID=G2WQI0_VERDV|nr:uncharacterized protein VDAG_00622 [Verticillium dahliae VdLs.17]KAF3350728.1 N amino acid transport system protein [Verticillium dahliae VDG2]KAH6710414.1 hypothetical protein EV126DRAFT_22259 [Verticillium dahliae]EGY13940.1 hypothetical protein VDAG_00622 [Verticillium dahliae VdLs.17]PNH33146.1 hypothetical protein BJF96_g3435 [Verticillium dahliae]PNH41224.1 hypothetical protein VD0003_g9995 [Verticillium dahliae]